MKSISSLRQCNVYLRGETRKKGTFWLAIASDDKVERNENRNWSIHLNLNQIDEEYGHKLQNMMVKYTTIWKGIWADKRWLNPIFNYLRRLSHFICTRTKSNTVIDSWRGAKSKKRWRIMWQSPQQQNGRCILSMYKGKKIACDFVSIIKNWMWLQGGMLFHTANRLIYGYAEF